MQRGSARFHASPRLTEIPTPPVGIVSVVIGSVKRPLSSLSVGARAVVLQPIISERRTSPQIVTSGIAAAKTGDGDLDSTTLLQS
jgi:hypothetical protein